MITHPRQAPFGLAVAQLSRILTAASSVSPALYHAPPADDPVFLPDCAMLTPDQAQELRYGKGRHQ